jgi:hypothetical protein
MYQKQWNRAMIPDQPELNRNATLESLLILGKRYCAIHHLILHVLDLI